MNDTSRLHLTVFYLSHVQDARPAPHQGDGGRSLPAPTQATLQQEAQKLRADVSSFPTFAVQVCVGDLDRVPPPPI